MARLIGDGTNPDLEKKIDTEMDRVIGELADISDTDEYTKMVANLNSLSNVKAATAKSRSGWKAIDPNQVITAGVYILGIGMILADERGGHVFSSAARNFLKRP